MSFAAIEWRDPIAARLLTLLAFLNFDDIFIHLFQVNGLLESPCRLDGEESRSGRWQELLTFDATKVYKYMIEAGFAVLQAYSLVSWQVDQEAYSMHKLVHAWSYDRLGDELRREWSLALLELLSVAVHDYDSDLNTGTRLVPHVMVNFTSVSLTCGTGYCMSDSDRECVERIGRLLRKLGRWEDEYRVRAYLKRITELVLGLEHPYTLMSVNDLARVLSKQGKDKEAGEMHRAIALK